MNVKNSILCILSCSLFMNTSFANLPDEINYPPFKSAYNALALNVDRITDELTSAEAELEQAYSNESRLSQRVETLEQSNDQLLSEISACHNELNQQKRLVSDLENKIRDQKNRKSRLSREADKLESNIERERRRLSPIKNKIISLNSKLNAKKGEVSSAESKLRHAKKNLASKKQQLSQLTTTINQLKISLKKQKNQLKTIDSQIATVKNQISSIPAKIQSAKSAIKSQESKLTSLETKLKTKQQELVKLMRSDRQNPRVKVLRIEVRGLISQVNKQKRQVQAAKVNLKKVQASKNKLQQRISRLEQQKSSLPTAIARTKSSILKNENNLQSRRRDIQQASSHLSDKEQVLTKIKSSFDQLKQEVSGLKMKLQRESVALHRLNKDLNDVEVRLKTVVHKIKSNMNKRQAAVASIERLKRAIPSLESQLRSNSSEISQTENDLRVTRDNIVSLNQAVNNLSSEQSVAISRRDVKYREYQERLSLYNVKLQEAQTLGANQTGNASDLATKASDQNVEIKSTKIADSMATLQANAQASFWGSARGEISGYNEGYQVGYASTLSRSEGAKKGTESGFQAAKDYAQTVLKPKFFKEYFQMALKKPITNINPVDIEPKNLAPLELGTFAFMAIAFNNVIDPLTPGELRESQNIKTSLDKSINQFHVENIQALERTKEMSVASNVYESPAKIPLGKVNCGSVYKGIVDFQNACKSSYKATFTSLYVNTFRTNFGKQYKDLYLDKLVLKRDQLIESLFNIAYEKFYAVAKGEGVIVGKQDIFDESFVSAKKLSYDAALPDETIQVKAVAQKEVGEWIEKNPTIVLESSSIFSGSLRGNTDAGIRLMVKNLSPVDLVKPVRVVITEALNANFVQKTFFLKNAPAGELSSFEDIIFKVSSRARSGQPIKISGYLEVSGGKYEQTRLESFTVNALTALNPAMSSRLLFDSTPKVVSGVRRRTFIHNLDVNVSPVFESIANGYTVSLAAAPGFQGMVNFKNTSVRTGRIDIGFFQRARFSYTFPRSSENRTVKLLLTYFHLGDVVKTETIQLRPH